MEYNKHTMFNRKRRCELEESFDAFIPYVGNKAKKMVDDLMDDDAVKVLSALEAYCLRGEQTELKDELLKERLQKLICIRELGKNFISDINNELKQ